MSRAKVMYRELSDGRIALVLFEDLLSRSQIIEKYGEDVWKDYEKKDPCIALIQEGRSQKMEIESRKYGHKMPLDSVFLPSEFEIFKKALREAGQNLRESIKEYKKKSEIRAFLNIGSFEI